MKPRTGVGAALHGSPIGKLGVKRLTMKRLPALSSGAQDRPFRIDTPIKPKRRAMTGLGPHTARNVTSLAALARQHVDEVADLLIGQSGGRVEQANFDSYTQLRMSDVPTMDISIIANGEPARGCGEPAVTVVDPAIANAVFKAVGARVRILPITAEAVGAAMKA